MTRVREWKPGDVAMTAKNTVALCGNSGRFIDQGGAPWSDDRFPNNLRPLVVIDPEDREQVERLVTAYLSQQSVDLDNEQPMTVRELRMRAALREFADPKPRIEEPTGLGAVVELARGDFLVRAPGTVDDKANWADMHGDFHEWSDLDVVEVHHDGWAGL